MSRQIGSGGHLARSLHANRNRPNTTAGAICITSSSSVLADWSRGWIVCSHRIEVKNKLCFNIQQVFRILLSDSIIYKIYKQVYEISAKDGGLTS